MARHEESRSTRDFYFRDQDISLGETTNRGGKFTYHWPGDYKAIIKYNKAVGNSSLQDIDTYKGWAYGYTHGANLTCQDFINDDVYIRDAWGDTHLFIRWDHGDEGHTATTENAADLPFMNYAGEVHPGRHNVTGTNMIIYLKWQPKYTGRVRIRGMIFDGHKTDMYNTTDATGVNWWIAKMVGNPTTLAGGAGIWRQYHDGGNTRIDGIGSFDFETDVTANQSDWYMLAIGPDGEQAYDTTPVEMMIEYVDPPVLQNVSLKENLIDNARWYTILPGWEDSDGNWQQGSGKGPYLYPENPANNPIDASLGAWRSSYIMPTMALLGWDSNTFVVNALNCPPEVVLGWNFYDLIENATVADFNINTTRLHRVRTDWPYASPFAGSTLEMRTPGHANRRFYGSTFPYEYRWLERGGGLNYSQWPHQVRSSFNINTQGYTVGASPTHDLGTTTNAILPADAGPFDVDKNIGTAYRFNDWGDDIFDQWGHWWVQPEGSEPIAIPLPNTSTLDALYPVTRTWQGVLNGVLFEIQYGYAAVGIWRMQIVAGDHSASTTNGVNNKFRVGTWGNLGSDSSTKTKCQRDGMSYNGNVAEGVSIYYDQWWQNGSTTERHYHYVVPFNVSDNLYRPYATGQYILGHSYMYTDWLTHGVTLYLSKTNNVIQWVENDLDFYQNFYT